MVTDDYLFCESRIIDHLRASIPDLVEVGSAAGLEAIQDGNVPVPSAWVFYLGDAVSGSTASVGGQRAQQQTVTQLWAVLLAVYFADGRGLGADINGTAGPLISRVLEAMRGWTPDEKTVPRVRRSAQQLPVQYDNGYGFYPLVYQIQIPASLGGY